LDRICNAGFVIKRGIELTGTSSEFRRVDLARIGENRRDWTLQVERSEFDKILIDAAAETAGVTVLQKDRVTALLPCAGRVSGVRYIRDGQEHSTTARFVVDASGQAGVVARTLNLRKPDNDLKMAAIFKHFGGVNEGNNPATEGDIQLGG